MSRFAFLALLALGCPPSFAQQAASTSEKPVEFPLRCDRKLSTDSTLFLLESAPLWLLEKHQRHSFPYKLASTGLGRFFFQLDRSPSQRRNGLEAALPKLVEELRGFDRGFSFAALYFPYKTKKYTYLNMEGITFLGQTSNKEWLRNQWNRLRPLFEDPQGKVEETRALGESPITATWLYGTYLRPDGQKSQGALGAIAHAQRGSYGGFFTGTYYGWNETSAKERLSRVLGSGEKALATGLGAMRGDRKGASIPGVKVLHPEGTVLGRLLFQFGPFMKQEENLHGRKGIQGHELFGFLSIQGAQDTVWVKGDRLFEKLQILENNEANSVFEALTPLDSAPSAILPLLPKKAIGYLRFRFNLDWLRELFGRTQKKSRFALSKSELALTLNTIRAIAALPIPEDPLSLEDLKGSVEIALLISPPSPGSYWPEIFVLTPKREKRLSPKDRLGALTQPFYAIFLGRGEKQEDLAKSIKTLGKGVKALSFVNYAKVITEHQKKSWFRMPTGAYPGAGNFCAAENDAYSILCFTPSAMRRFLRSPKKGAKAESPSWLPKEILGQKGDLLQGTLRLQDLVPFYPLSLFLAFSTTSSGPIKNNSDKNKKKAQPKVPTARKIAKLLGTETFRFYRLPSQGEGRGLLVMDHQGEGLFSPFNIATLAFGAATLDQLFRSIPR